MQEDLTFRTYEQYCGYTGYYKTATKGHALHAIKLYLVVHYPEFIDTMESFAKSATDWTRQDI